MKNATLIGLLLGGATLSAVGLAAAKGKSKEPAADEPYFVYVIQPGDSLSDLAFKFFGDAKKWPIIAEANAALLPSDNNVPAGAKVRVPCVWVTVQKGDTLAAIAQRVLGDGARWRRIMEANRNASANRLPDPDKLAVGQRLAVPLAPSRAEQADPTVAVGDLDMLGAECLP